MEKINKQFRCFLQNNLIFKLYIYLDGMNCKFKKKINI